MRKAAAVLFALAVFFNAGCGGDIKGEKEMKKVIEAMKEASEAKDPAKAMEGLGKIIAAQAELEKLNLTGDEKAKLHEKYKSEFEKYEKKK